MEGESPHTGKSQGSVDGCWVRRGKLIEGKLRTTYQVYFIDLFSLAQERDFMFVMPFGSGLHVPAANAWFVLG